MKPLACIASLVALTAAVQAADLGAMDEPIRLAINEWTGQHVTTHIAGQMLEAAGYKVDYVTAGYMNMYQAMADGELHAALEIYGSNVPAQYGKLESEASSRIWANWGWMRKRVSPIRRMSRIFAPACPHGRR